MGKDVWERPNETLGLPRSFTCVPYGQVNIIHSFIYDGMVLTQVKQYTELPKTFPCSGSCEVLRKRLVATGMVYLHPCRCRCRSACAHACVPVLFMCMSPYVVGAEGSLLSNVRYMRECYILAGFLEKDQSCMLVGLVPAEPHKEATWEISIKQ